MKTSLKILLSLGLISILLSISGLTFYQKRFQMTSKTILPNIYIDHVSVGKLTKEEAVNTLYRIYTKSEHFKIRLFFEKKKIAEVNSRNLNYELPIKSLVDQVYTIGREPGLSALYQQLALNMGFESYNFDLNPQFSEAYITDLLNELDAAYRKKPVEARFEFKNNKVEVFKMDEDGFRLNTNYAKQQLILALNKQRFKPKSVIKVVVPKQIIEAKIRLKDINSLGIKELVAQGSSHFAGSAPERVHNIVTGANKLNGQLIKPGQTFSFNEFLGEISSRTGFAPAFVIKNGKTVLDDGGGICQVSTTMFRTALNAGVPILERTAHAYRVGYYEQDAKPGLDATIYLPSVDFKFKNNYDSALLIQADVDLNEMKLTFTFYGKRDNRQASISDIIMWNIAPPPPAEYIDDFNLPEGTTKQVDFAAWGTSSKFTYTVSYPNGEVKEQEFISNFRPWKAIYLVGKKTN